MKKIPILAWPISGAVLAFSAVALAATTISTDITTGGNLTAATSSFSTLTVSATSTLNGLVIPLGKTIYYGNSLLVDSNGNLQAAVIPLEDTAANLANTVPAAGQMVYETDTGYSFVGDGTHSIANLHSLTRSLRTGDVPSGTADSIDIVAGGSDDADAGHGGNVNITSGAGNAAFGGNVNINAPSAENTGGNVNISADNIVDIGSANGHVNLGSSGDIYLGNSANTLNMAGVIGAANLPINTFDVLGNVSIGDYVNDNNGRHAPSNGLIISGAVGIGTRRRMALRSFT